MDWKKWSKGRFTWEVVSLKEQPFADSTSPHVGNLKRKIECPDDQTKAGDLRGHGNMDSERGMYRTI